MITLGLDPSLTGFGWCIHNGSVAGLGRVIAKGHLSAPSSRILYWRFMYLRSVVSQLLTRFPEVESVGVESTTFGEDRSETLYGLFLYVNEAILLHRKDVVYFDPRRVKLLAKMDPSVRKGTMDKSDMVDAARQDTGIRGWNHNEADAYLIARSAARFWDLHAGRLSLDELTPSERHVFAHIHTYSRGTKAGRTVKKGILFQEGARFYQFSTLKKSELKLPQIDFDT